MRLLLASKSAARRRMLEAAGVPFETVETRFDESGVKAAMKRRGLGAAEIALALAEGKARVAAAEGLVLGSDQVLELEDGSMLDKPQDRDEAMAQLRAMSGRPHKLHTAGCVIDAGVMQWRHVETVAMHVRPLGKAFLQDYLDREWEQVRWSVGGYHVEGRGAQLFERIEGSLFAVQGLPLLPLLGFLRERGLLFS
ncbi:MAG TPA: Maf family protein [Allosphingosinicella sp.]|jgi:septum formation protein|uniref:Maf family protein n=1 Tax=Allosphingosinicella sp. TaxID=2823234 RepID=UPI002F290770